MTGSCTVSALTIPAAAAIRMKGKVLNDDLVYSPAVVAMHDHNTNYSGFRRKVAVEKIDEGVAIPVQFMSEE